MESEIQIGSAEKKIRFTFLKEERLSRKKMIDTLFEKGRNFYIYPLKIYHLETPLPTKFPAQILITVSKKHFQRAVDRNRLKRWMRESYRKNKHFLYRMLSREQKQVAIACIYQSEKMENYSLIEQKMVETISRLIQTHEVH